MTAALIGSSPNASHEDIDKRAGRETPMERGIKAKSRSSFRRRIPYARR
jgi:hypothetical protein